MNPDRSMSRKYLEACRLVAHGRNRLSHRSDFLDQVQVDLALECGSATIKHEALARILLTISKRDQRPQNIEYDGRADGSIHIQLSKVLNTGDTSLIEFKDVFLEHKLCFGTACTQSIPPCRFEYPP